MQFEDQNAAMRQMKELLRDQAKFRAKLDRVVRKIETSSERTAKLAERNKARKHSSNGNGNGHRKSGGGGVPETNSGTDDTDGSRDMQMEAAGATSAQAVS
jgi:hypothetical protein